MHQPSSLMPSCDSGLTLTAVLTWCMFLCCSECSKGESAHLNEHKILHLAGSHCNGTLVNTIVNSCECQTASPTCGTLVLSNHAT